MAAAVRASGRRWKSWQSRPSYGILWHWSRDQRGLVTLTRAGRVLPSPRHSSTHAVGEAVAYTTGRKPKGLRDHACLWFMNSPITSSGAAAAMERAKSKLEDLFMLWHEKRGGHELYVPPAFDGEHAGAVPFASYAEQAADAAQNLPLCQPGLVELSSGDPCPPAGGGKAGKAAPPTAYSLALIERSAGLSNPLRGRAECSRPQGTPQPMWSRRPSRMFRAKA